MNRRRKPANWLISLCTLLIGWGSLLSAFTPVHALTVQNTASATVSSAAPCHSADAVMEHDSASQSAASYAGTAHGDCPDCAQSLCQQLCHWLTMPGHTALVSVTPPPQTLPERLFYSPLLGHSSRLLRPPQHA